LRALEHFVAGGLHRHGSWSYTGRRYGTPKDPGAFDTYYFENQVPIAKRIPGPRKYEVSRGAVESAGGPTRFHLIATLHFDDVKAIQLAFASPQGQAAAADVATFSTGGVDMIFFDSAEI
jgi:uncharacterized protein (TIGR02118 family)